MRLTCPVCRNELRDRQFLENKIVHIQSRGHDDFCPVHNLEDLDGFANTILEAELYELAEGVE